MNNGNSLYRFMPSLAQDKVGNAAAGYSVSSSTVEPGIRAAYWSLAGKTTPVEIALQNGVGDEENSSHWGDYTSMTVDPTDGCTFWYVNQYYQVSETGIGHQLGYPHLQLQAVNLPITAHSEQHEEARRKSAGFVHRGNAATYTLMRYLPQSAGRQC